jgi:hypothetical protein
MCTSVFAMAGVIVPRRILAVRPQHGHFVALPLERRFRMTLRASAIVVVSGSNVDVIQGQFVVFVLAAGHVSQPLRESTDVARRDQAQRAVNVTRHRGAYGLFDRSKRLLFWCIR